MKKFLKVFFILVFIAACFILIDASVAYLRKKEPIIHWGNEITDGKVTHTLFYDIYYCYNLGELNSTEWKGKKTEYTCPKSDIVLKEENVVLYNYTGFFNKNRFIRKIESKDELKEATRYIKPFNKKYDEEFFNTRSIILAYLPTGANSTITFDEIIVGTSSVTVKIKEEKARADKDNSTGYALFIEIDKEYVADKSFILDVK